MGAFFDAAGVQDGAALATRLLEEYSSIGRMLEASPEALCRSGGEKGPASLLLAARAMIGAVLKRRLLTAPIVSGLAALNDYLHAQMAFRDTEGVRVLHLNVKNRLIRDELVAEGSIDKAAFHVREVARRALELGSAAIILVHNHPSGDPTPSRQDVALTREIVAALRPLGIEVHDHLIVTTAICYSFRAEGLL